MAKGDQPGRSASQTSVISKADRETLPIFTRLHCERVLVGKVSCAAARTDPVNPFHRFAASGEQTAHLRPPLVRCYVPIIVLVVVASLLMLGYLGRNALLTQLGTFLVVSEPPVTSDAVLPLAGELERVTYAAELHREGYASRFLVTALPFQSQKQRAAHTSRVSDMAIQGGVPQAAIQLISGVAQTTCEEAQNVLTYLQTHRVKSLLVVTSPWHTRRTRLCFSQAYRGSGISVRILAFPRRSYDLYSAVFTPATWWRHSSLRESVLSEYVKLFAFYLGVR